MLVRNLALLAVLGLVALPAPAPAADDAATKPALLIRVQSIDDILSDIGHVAKLAGQEEQAKQIMGIVDSQRSPDGLKGIDPKRPIGLYGSIGANVGTDSTAVALIPVASENAILDFLKAINFEPKKEDDGTYAVTPAQLPVPIYFRFANKYAYVTARDKSALAKDKLMSPAQVFPAGQKDALFASFRIDLVPDFLKQLAVGQVELRLADLQDKKDPGETEAQHAFKVQVLKDVARCINQLLTEGEAITLRFNVDRQKNVVAEEFSLTAKSGSDLAKTITKLGQSQSAFAGLRSKDAALTALAHVALPEDLRKLLGPVVDEGIRKGLAKEQDAGKRQVGEKLLKALDPTLKAGEFDGGLSLRKSTSGDLYTLVLGVKLKEGEGLRSALHDIAQNLPPAERSKVHLDAETVDGVKVTRVEPGNLDENARRMFGDNPFFFVVRPDAAFVTGGADGLKAMKEALAAKPQTSHQAQVEISFARFAGLMAAQKDQKGDPVAAAKKAFTGPDAGHDKLTVTLQGGESLKVHSEVQGAVITFLSLIDKKSKEQ